MNLGARGSYTLSRRIGERPQELAVGYATRLDQGRTELVRLRDRLQIPYARDFDNSFDILNAAGWMRLQIEALEWLTMRGGLRLDTFGFGVRDRTQVAEDTEGPRLTEQTVQAYGTSVNPRVSAAAHLTEARGQRGLWPRHALDGRRRALGRRDCPLRPVRPGRGRARLGPPDPGRLEAQLPAQLRLGGRRARPGL